MTRPEKIEMFVMTKLAPALGGTVVVAWGAALVALVVGVAVKVGKAIL